jgi:acyl-CoA thioesterase YciA
MMNPDSQPQPAPTMTAPPSDRYLALKAVMMPRDTNPHGTIFGGVLLSYIDQAGAVGAQHEVRRAGWPAQPLVTVAMKSVEFHRPCYVGDVVSFWTELHRVGRTSITMHVTVEADHAGTVVQLTEAEVTYVAVQLIDGERQPVPLQGATA